MQEGLFHKAIARNVSSSESLFHMEPNEKILSVCICTQHH